MSTFRLANPLLVITLGVLVSRCGRKGDPIPRARAAAQAMEVSLEGLRMVRLVLPSADVKGGPLVGVEVVPERRRPDLPGPDSPLLMDLKSLQRPQGWIVVVAVRVGNVPGRPSEVLPWLDPAL